MQRGPGTALSVPPPVKPSIGWGLLAGLPLVRANNDPRAGLIRLRTLIEPDETRRFPLWHPRAGECGSPQLFVVGRRCTELVEQLRSAPLQPIDKADAGEKVDPIWEGRYGHFCAMARYAVMSRPSASEEPEAPFETAEEAARWLRADLLRRDDERFESAVSEVPLPSYSI